MNTQSHAIPGSPLESQVDAPAVIPAARLIYWSLRRELWENRSIYIAPLAAAALYLVGFLISLTHLPAKLRAEALNPVQQHYLLARSYHFAAFLIMGITLIVAVFYCLDALHSERRDRSILFWKSLPVSDLTTVLSKASIPIIILPLITFVITFALWCIILLLSSVVLLGSGVSVVAPWTQFPLFQMSLILLYHLLGMHGFWYAPFYGWLLMVSAWSRRAAFLWATLPLFAIGIVEKIAFNTSYFANMVAHRFIGGGEPMDNSRAKSMEAILMPHMSLGQFLTSPGLWIGLVVTAAFLAAAVRLRRYRGPI